LHRLGLESEITQRLEPPTFLPAVGQGALGIECRADDPTTQELLAALDHPPTRRAVLAERACLAALEGGCSIPLAGWARDTDDGLTLDVAVLDPEGFERLFASQSGPRDDPEALGLAVAEALRTQGADRVLRQARPE